MHYQTRGPGVFARFILKGVLLGVPALMIMEPALAETEPQQAQHNATLFRRRPLARIRSWLRGTDLTINMNGSKASCQSTPVAKKELDSPEGMCRLAYLTAAHCVDNTFKSIDFAGIGEIPLKSMKVSIPQEYFRTGGASSRESHPGDSATLIFDVSCERAKSVTPVPLAPTKSDGTTAITTSHVYLQKRQEETVGNRGEGAQIKADVTNDGGNMYEFYAPSPQGYAIVGGDSGGPIFNEKGELICPISGSSYEFKRETGQLRRPRKSEDSILDPFTVICDKRAIARLKDELKRFGLTPASGLEAGDAVADSGASPGTASGSSQRPLQGNASGGGAVGASPLSQLGGSFLEPPQEGECRDGVCHMPDSLGGGSASHTDALPGLQRRPQAAESASDSAASQIPARSSGGFSEIGPVKTADLAKVMEQAKQQGFKHIVIRYGNDRTCHFCRELREELRREFGSDSDVMVIKVEDSRPVSGQGIPQSELHSLDEGSGDWKKQGGARVGAGAGKPYKDQVQAQRATQRAQQQAQQPAQQPPQRQAQRPPSGGSTPPAHQTPSTPQPERARPLSNPSSAPQGTAASGSEDDSVVAPEPPRNVFNGYQFKPAEEGGGLHFLKPGEEPAAKNGIFLKRLPDGGRKAARKNGDGKLEFLPEDVQEGLRQYYTTHQDKVAHLPEKQRKYVEEFIQGVGKKAPEANPVADAQPQAEPASLPTPTPQAHQQTKPPADPAAQRIIDQYENQMKYTGGNKRYRFPEDMFKDIPEGGTGKLVLAYFGARNAQLEESAKDHPLIEVRRYDLGSPEHKHAQLFGVQALGVDGLGRKLTRYAMSPQEALRSLMNGDEVKLLEKYVAAKKAVAGNWHEPEKEPAPTRQTPHSGSPAESHAPAQPHAQLPTRPQAPDSAAAALPESRFDKTTLGHFMSGNCASCHNDPFPSFTSNWQEWEKRLERKDPEALSWLQRFNSKVVHGEMLANAHLSKEEGAGRDFHSFIAQQYQRYFGKAERETASTSIGNPHADFRIDPAKRGEYLEALANANIQDPALLEALMNFDAIYDHVGAPPSSWAFHGGDSGRKGARPLSFAPSSVVRPHLFKQVNGEWHWKEPFDGGFSVDSNSEGLKTFIVAKFPRDAQGNIIKGVVGTEKSPRNVSAGSATGFSTPLNPDRSDLDRIYGSHPEGTTYYEVQYSTSLGKPMVVTVLSREKRINEDGTEAFWSPDVHKADSSPETVLRWAQAKQKANPENPDYQRIIDAVNNPQQDVLRSDLGATGAGGKPFLVNGRKSGAITGSKSVLNGVDPKTLREMYTELPLTSSAGSSGWQLEAQQVFKNTHRGLPVDSQTCANCHRFAGESFGDVFADAGLENGSVIAYGSMQGFDGVLSVPQFDAEQLEKYAQSHRTPNQDPYAQGGFVQRFFQSFSSGVSPQSHLRTKAFPQLSDGPLLPRRK